VPKGRDYERIQRGKVISNVEQVDEKALSVDLCDRFRQSWRALPFHFVGLLFVDLFK
jgi:hypothetical protein